MPVFTLGITDSSLTRAVETAVRVTQHQGEEEEQEEMKFRMYICNSITRAVMN